MHQQVTQLAMEALLAYRSLPALQLQVMGRVTEVNQAQLPPNEHRWTQEWD